MKGAYHARVVGCHRAVVMAMTCTGTVWGQTVADVATARELAVDGVLAYEARDFDSAERKLAHALPVLNLATVALYRARALVQLKRYVEASEQFRNCLQLAADGDAKQESAKRTCDEERQALAPRIPRLVLELKNTDANEVSVEIDGRGVPPSLVLSGYLVDPGRHRVKAVATDRVATSEVFVDEGSEARTILVFPTTLAPPTGRATASPRRESSQREKATTKEGRRARPLDTLAWTALGLGTGALAFGIWQTVRVDRQKQWLDDAGCQGTHCSAALAAQVNDYNAARIRATVGYIGASVFTALGISILLVSHGPESHRDVGLYVGPSRIGAIGRF